MRAFAGILLGTGSIAAFWGFSVDDAWIVARIAQHAVDGAGSWNLGEPATDAVTPLGFAQAVAAILGIAGRFGADAFSVARFLGVFAWLSCFALLGALWKGSEKRLYLALLCLGASAGGAAWAGAGLETPVVALFVLLGAVGLGGPEVEGRGRAAISGMALGLAAGWRPELLPFVAVLIATGSAKRRPRATLLVALAALAPVVAIALVRNHLFARWLPLSFEAKEPSFSLGLRYSLGGLLLSGAPWLALTQGFRKTNGATLAPLLAPALALIVAGGDWMPLHRLWVPLCPWLVWSGFTSTRRGRWREWSAISLVFGCFLVQFVAFGADGRAVVERRGTWVARGREWLEGARVVAAVDIGWVGRAFPGRVVDLAGVTDPKVAALPGGHTSKLISAGFFAGRDVDAWVVRAFDRNFRMGDPEGEIVAYYEVDHRLLRRAVDLGFHAVGVIPIEGTPGQYVVLRTRPTPDP